MTENTDLARSSMPLCDTFGVVTLHAEPAHVRLELEWAPHLCTSAGILHGGSIMALADSAGGLCAFLNLPTGSVATATIESKTNFFGAVRDGKVVARRSRCTWAGPRLSSRPRSVAVTDSSPRPPRPRR